jgi:hypothetical protein
MDFIQEHGQKQTILFYSMETKFYNQVKQNILDNIIQQIKKLNETTFTQEEIILQQKYQDELYTFSLIDYEFQTKKIKDYHFNYLQDILNSCTAYSNKNYYRIVELNQLRCELNTYYIGDNFMQDSSVMAKHVKYILDNYVYV